MKQNGEVLLEKTSSIFDELGVIAACLYFIERLLKLVSSKWACHYYYFYDQPLRQQKIAQGARPVYDFYWLGELNEQIQELPRPKRVLECRFKSGTKCLVVQSAKDQQFLGCAWFATKPYQEDEVNCIYDFSDNKSFVWDFDIYIVPEHRMSRLFLRLWQNAENQLAGNGCTNSLSRISAYNANSVKSHESFGAKKIGWALFLKINKAQFMISSQVPYMKVSWGLSGQPVLIFS